MSDMVVRVDWDLWEKCTTSRECKTKYLAVSPVTDNFEDQDFEAVQESPHPNFLIKILRDNMGRGSSGKPRSCRVIY